MSNPITVRPATPADLDTVAQLIALGFNQDEVAHRVGLENNPRYKVTDFVLAEIDGQAVGTGGMFTTQMWLSGVPLQMGAVCNVTTHPDFRQRGVSKTIIDVLLEKMTQQKIAVSVLFPTAHAVYQNAGYTTAAVWHAYHIKPENLLTSEEAEHVRLFKPEDLPALRSVYRGSQLSQADGRLTRSTAHWENIVAEQYRTGEYAVLVYDDNGVQGYVKCQMRDNGTINVIETVVSTDEAYRGIWSYLATRSNISAIDYLAPADDPILHLLRTPGDSAPEETTSLGQQWYYHSVYHATASFMLRVINVEEALTSRFYPHDMMGNRVLKIHDPKIPQNETPINFRIVDGRPDILPVEGKEPELETDIVTFSQVYCGFLPPDTARRLGRLKADDETIAWIERAMQTSPLYIHNGDWF